VKNEARAYFARASIWTFKKGQREKGLKTMEEKVSNVARITKGYCGFIQLLSEEDPESATIITLWEDNETRESSSKGLFKDAIKAVIQYVERPPDLSNFSLTNAELRI
jgi:heme-degrading monooxygenase HmoA